MKDFIIKVIEHDTNSKISIVTHIIKSEDIKTAYKEANITYGTRKVFSVDELSIDNTLSKIQEQSGLKLTLCDYFTGIQKCNGKKYFNVELKDRSWNSNEYTTLERLVKKGIISGVEPNGVTRVAIYF